MSKRQAQPAKAGPVKKDAAMDAVLNGILIELGGGEVKIVAWAVAFPRPY